MLEISEDKALKVTYGALIFMLVILFGFGAWMTSVELKAQDNNQHLEKIDLSYDKVGEAVINIDKRLSRIEGLLERMFNE